MRLSNLMIIILIPAIAGLDFRFNWFLLETNLVLIGLFFVVALLFTFFMGVFPIILRFLKIIPSNPNPIKTSIF